jgi:hypothetical protein
VCNPMSISDFQQPNGKHNTHTKKSKIKTEKEATNTKV